MSKYNNVNPDHYRLRGRERPGKGIVPKERPRTTEEIEQEPEGKNAGKGEAEGLKAEV